MRNRVEPGAASACPASLDQIDWTQPWLAPWRARGEPLARAARLRGLIAALNAATTEDMVLDAGRVQFVEQAALPTGEAYEAFIARTACVPTRNNLHDLFNGLVWLSCPMLKRRLNELQAAAIAQAVPDDPRGALRDALTLFDENAALLQAPPLLVEALRRRDWHALFVTHRAAWVDARLTLFGHALMEKLTRPRKAITAHVWLIETPPDGGVAVLAPGLTPELLAAKPFLTLPVLGVPGWWAPNEHPEFYRDTAVFRPERAQSEKKTAALRSLS